MGLANGVPHVVPTQALLLPLPLPLLLMLLLPRVVVGGGRPLDALQLLVAQPVLWAAVVGLALNAAAVPRLYFFSEGS